MDGKLRLSKLFTAVPDPNNALIYIGKTVNKYPGVSFFTGRMKQLVYTNQVLDETEIAKLSQKADWTTNQWKMAYNVYFMYLWLIFILLRFFYTV